jgi:hypothetical protein
MRSSSTRLSVFDTPIGCDILLERPYDRPELSGHLPPDQFKPSQCDALGHQLHHLAARRMI